MARAAAITPLQTASPTPGLPSGTAIGLGVLGNASISGGPPAPDVVASYVPSEDTVIPGALQINPAYAGDFYAGRFLIERPIPGDRQMAVPKSKVDSQNAIDNLKASDNAWKKRLPPREAIQFGPGVAPQPLFKYPWNKKFIPPLALFNDAAQWVNRLMFLRPMTWFDADTSNPPLKAQYFSPPPVNTHNLAAATLNLQMQLGRMAIQAQQLTVSASNYFG